MTKWVLYTTDEEKLYKCYVSQGTNRMITIGNELKHSITVPSLSETYSLTWNGESFKFDNDKMRKFESISRQIGDKTFTFYVAPNADSMYSKFFDCSNELSVFLGQHEKDDIRLRGAARNADISLIRKQLNSPFTLYVNRGDIYHNYKRVYGEVTLDVGDMIFFYGVVIVIHDEQSLQIISHGDNFTTTLTPIVTTERFDEEYPDYHRSPRIIYREPQEKKVIAKPTQPPSKPSEQLMRTIIPPIVMIAALGLVSIFQPRGIFIIVMLTMTVTTVIISITTYIKNVKEYRIKMKKRNNNYTEYLLRKTKELHETVEEQRFALAYHYPSVTEITELAQKVDARIYEKTIFHHDFLSYRAGLGTVDTSFEVEFTEEEFTEEEDELVVKARDLHGTYQKINHVPVTTSLTQGPLGYIGQRSLVIEQLQMLIMQLAFFHSYHELQFITIFPEEEKSKWDWMRWLPHAKLQDLNIRGFVYNERTRDQVLTSLYQILKERKQVLTDKEDKRDKRYFTPHYVILITDEKIALDHTVMEFFDEDTGELSVSLVFVQDVLQSLPEHVTTVIDIRDKNNGNILLEEGELVNQYFIPDHFPKGFNKEILSRSLAPLNHLLGLKSSIPEAVTFLEMYNIEKVEEIDLATNWEVNETYKSLAVPLGLRAADDIVYLNLHEKAHGPHGLVAGTTGSGKSEIIQSYIISLAVNFHPHEVAFLLIDYKGGGMANLFKDLPHLLGTITNLDGAQSMRALASIKAELERRQRLFGEYDVNHINQYQKLIKQGDATEPLPHLFLISDEFAELKAEQPEFMKELVSTARIGRSLGIHLILATQKPSGVVDDQIWSNSKFKLALKVQDESDSNEILKTPDAAEITLPGRAYLQVGNNEIYELFQSAWSGADYVHDQNDPNVVDLTVYHINELGQYEILTKDLSGLDKKGEVKKKKTELEAVVDYIHEFTKKHHIIPLSSPWLPPLETNIYLEDLVAYDFQKEWKKEKRLLSPTVGFADFPKEQAQRKLQIPLSKDGHIALFSSPGYGKSTFLQTVAMGLARVHRPCHIHIYLLDFGTNGLLPLRDLPHVADSFLIDDGEKIGKLIRRMEHEIKERKKLLSEYKVATLEMYEKVSGNDIPNIVLMVDNYDAVREVDYVEPFERVITQIAREGASIGIHLLISASRQNVLRMPLISNIKTQISLYLIDELDSRAIVGRTELEIEEIPGRGLIKLEEPTLFQTALPTRGDDTLAIIENIQQEAKVMNSYWNGERPKAIPMMPEEPIAFAQFEKHEKLASIVSQGMLPLGLDYEHVEPLAFDFAKYGNLIAIGDRMDRNATMQRALLKNMSLLKDTYRTMVIDTSDKKLEDIGKELESYIYQPEQLAGLKNDLLEEIRYRQENKIAEPKWLIMIANVREFVMHSMITEDEINSLIHATSLGFQFIICSEYSYLGTSFEQVPKTIRSNALAGLVCMRLSDQDVFKQRYISNEKTLEPYESYFAMDHQYEKIKLPM